MRQRKSYQWNRNWPSIVETRKLNSTSLINLFISDGLSRKATQLQSLLTSQRCVSSIKEELGYTSNTIVPSEKSYQGGFHCTKQEWLRCQRVNSPSGLHYMGLRIRLCRASSINSLASSMNQFTSPQDELSGSTPSICWQFS